MNKNEIQSRLEIIKLSIPIEDIDTIIIQTTKLKQLNNSTINEIINLLHNKNYKQALYLIKNFMLENGMVSNYLVSTIDDDNEYVLGVEDMLKMSPLAKEAIKSYKSSHYTQDDLEAFAKNIEVPVSKEYENISPDISSYEETIEKIQNGEIKTQEEHIEKIEDDVKENNDYTKAVNSASSDTPLDEISTNMKKKKKVVAQYKVLREKFAKKDKKEKVKEDKPKGVLSKVTQKIKSVKKEAIEQLHDNTSNVSENLTPQKSKEKDEIYPPIPHIEQKFRQAFVLYPPIKESDVWIEDVVKFLKLIEKNSYKESQVKEFLDKYQELSKQGDIAKASQYLLLGSTTNSKYAMFILARELFSGRILRRDLKKSFLIMKDLANSLYPEAICDLGQFYEYGIGVPKNKKIALKLYEKSFELGVERATKHINRIRESGGIFSSILKL